MMTTAVDSVRVLRSPDHSPACQRRVSWPGTNSVPGRPKSSPPSHPRFRTRVGAPLSERPDSSPHLLAAFFGLPPMRPFTLEAARLAALLDLPPTRPNRDAIHRLDPRNPSKRLGR